MMFVPVDNKIVMLDPVVQGGPLFRSVCNAEKLTVQESGLCHSWTETLVLRTSHVHCDSGIVNHLLVTGQKLWSPYLFV